MNRLVLGNELGKGEDISFLRRSYLFRRQEEAQENNSAVIAEKRR